MVRFNNSGDEATMFAIRLLQAFAEIAPARATAQHERQNVPVHA